MSDRKLAKTVQSLLRQIWRLHRSITKSTIAWLLRTALVINRRSRHATAGFVLPTTVLLILVVTLTAGALTYRAFNTSTRTIADTQSRVIYNAATPAIDRARSKIEFMFDSNKDTRFPGGVPPESLLVSMMLNGSPGVTIKNDVVQPLTYAGGNSNGMGNTQDPYTLPDETRADINRDGLADNAWRYRIDTNGDGNQDATVIYSILLSTPPDGNADQPGWKKLIGMTDRQKADGELDPSNPSRRVSYVRHGPLNDASRASSCRVSTGGGGVEKGWYESGNNTSNLSKNFQVDAFVVPDSGGAGSNTYTTLEFSQDRIVQRGNKWGAWFRNDLEIFPGPQFNWNGAMHTEGSLIIGNNSFSAYLISSPSSCLFSPESNSEITITDTLDSDIAAPNNVFKGILASGKVNDSSYGGASLIYLQNGNGFSTSTLDSTRDWASGSNPYEISLNPVDVYIRDGYRSRAPNPTNVPYYSRNNNFGSRIRSDDADAPYVDDTYRADNRYGPKLVYDKASGIPSGRRVGQIIQPGDNVSRDPSKNLAAQDKLLATDPAAGGDSANIGLDGYWERRARNQGLRVLVGQRLELGNTNGWEPPKNRPDDGDTGVGGNQPQNPSRPAPVSYPLGTPDSDLTDLRSVNLATNVVTSGLSDVSQADVDVSDSEGDPLYPPHGTNSHEAIQRRTLRDNLAAVQATAVYHAAVDRDYPVACFASTAHPGSPFTLRQSINFVPTFFVNSAPNGTPNLTSAEDTLLLTDFFNGRGTNGWEFEPPMGTATAFATAMNDINSPMRIALTNLAQFAGDHVSDAQTGAFPPTQEPGRVHPYPDLTMWGNYSNLRRTLAQLNTTSYNDLSPADKTYLQTAACTLGMLAHNIDQVQRFDPRNPNNDRARAGTSQVMFQLGVDLRNLMNGRVDEAAGDYEVLPRAQLATYGYSNTGTYDQNLYNPRDYDRVPAEAFLGKLREYYLATSSNPTFNDGRLRTAELIFSYFQIRRDRTYGFRSSPAANTWNYNPYVTTFANNGRTYLWSSACDPNLFSLNLGAPAQRVGGDIPATDYHSVQLRLAEAARLGLSRLCGTVIPAGAAHDFPGDYGLPQRNSTRRNLGKTVSTTPTADAVTIPPVADNTQYIPKITVAASSAYLYTAEGTRSPDGFTTTPAEGANNNLQTSPLWNRGVYLQATVAPKWPSLYYLFPEFEHNQDGTVVAGVPRVVNGVIDTENDGIGLNVPTPLPGGIPQNVRANSDNDWSDDIDQRQPTGALTDWFSSGDPASGRVMPAGFQPWAEPYIVDTYINGTVNGSARYRVVDTLSPSISPAVVGTAYPRRGGYITAGISFTTAETKDLASHAAGATATYSYRTFVNPLDDRPVSSVALRPRKLPTGFNNPFQLADNPEWQLPISVAPTTPAAQNDPPNRIVAPNTDRIQGTVAVIPFLDRAIFNGREWQPARVMDIDIGMLRRTRPRNQGGPNSSPEAYPSDSASKRDVWLPVNGIVYAFREDAVREDAIARPAGGTVSDARNANAQTDPAVRSAYVVGSTSCSTQPCLSIKAVDGIPDPERRVHGFRLRNGEVLRRHPDMGIPDQDNIRGLSFFTDQPVYIMGDYNLHQAGGDNDVAGTRLEEFVEQLPTGGAYNQTQFYNQRQTRETRFADPLQDRWRPSEILADAISVVSETLCDGSLIDTFMTTASTTDTLAETTYSGRATTDSGVAFPNGFYPYRRTTGDTGGATVYNNILNGLYGTGCTGTDTSGQRTTFLNQNRPNLALPANWSWMRENPNDIFSPVEISRNGQGMVWPPLPATTVPLVDDVTDTTAPFAKVAATTGSSGAAYASTVPSEPRMAGPYNANPVLGTYDDITAGRPTQNAQATRVNTIIVSGLVPSRQNQSYGGLHNFPRFIENWSNLWFAGSFLQLNFSNYATAPFDSEATEPGTNPTTAERIPYYGAPQRLWGYDVALQLAPAGPAASRFVTASRARNEFYSEPPANDPYINNLCRALPDAVIPDNRCPS